MYQQLIGLFLVLGLGSAAVADDVPPFPQQVPPIVGTAVVTNADALIVVLGPRDGYPAPDLLPAKKNAAAKS